MAALERLLYVSVSACADPSAALPAIVDSACRHNLADGITGALLSYGERFVQVLEGPPAAIDACLERLRGDARHRDLRVLDRRAIETRRFTRWSMRGIALPHGADRAVDAFLAALNAGPDAAQLAQAIELLARLAERVPDDA